MKIISIILIALAWSSLTIAMQHADASQPNFNAPPGVTVHTPRKKSVISALMAKLTMERTEDNAGAHLKASKKRAKKNKKAKVTQGWEEYISQLQRESKCLNRPGSSIRYLVEPTLLNM